MCWSLLLYFIRSKVFAVLCSQDPHQYFDQFAAAVASADDIKLQSPSANQCREIHAEACAVRAQIDTDAQAQVSRRLHVI